MSAPHTETTRPWTIPVLLVVSLAGLAWDVFSGAGASSWLSGVGVIPALVLLYGSWTARRWAFTVILATTLFLLVIVIPATYFLETDPPDVLPPAIFLSAQLVLLMNPTTREYATQRLDVAQAPVAGVAQENGRQPVGVRRNTIVALIFLLTAIAIAGTLGVIRIYEMAG